MPALAPPAAVDLCPMQDRHVLTCAGISRQAPHEHWHRTMIDLLDTRATVALSGDRVVGFAAWAEVAGGVGLTDLCVHPDWRRRGIGLRLVAAAAAAATRAGGRLAVCIPETDMDALRFAKWAGFVAVRVSRRPGEDWFTLVFDPSDDGTV